MQVVHSGDIICEGIIRIQKEPVKPEPPREEQPAQTAVEAEPVQNPAAQPMPFADGSNRKAVKPQPKQEDSAKAITKVWVMNPRLHISAAGSGSYTSDAHPQIRSAIRNEAGHAERLCAKEYINSGHSGMNASNLKVSTGSTITRQGCDGVGDACHLLRDCAVQGPAKDCISHEHSGMNGYSKLNGHRQDANGVMELETPESSLRGNGSQTSEVRPE